MAAKRDDNKAEAKPRGCFSKLIVLGLFLSAVGLGFSVYFMAQPQELRDIHGYTQATRTLLRRDIKVMLQQSLDRSYPVTITEGEINQWLLGVVKTKQGGLLADYATLDGVWVRLQDGRAEVVLERKVMGQPVTVSMYVQVEQTESPNGTRTEVHMHGGPYHQSLPFPKCGGRFGQLPVPQGFLLVVLPSFKTLAAIFPEEVVLGFEKMARIKIEKGLLTLDPRIPTKTVTSP